MRSTRTGICLVLRGLRRRRRGNVSHTDTVGILPGEEIIHAISRVSVISTNCIPSGNTHSALLLVLQNMRIHSNEMLNLHSASGFSREARHQNKKDTLKECPFRFGDPYGNRTHVFSVRGWCLNRLTNEPWLSRFDILSYNFLFVKVFF